MAFLSAMAQAKWDLAAAYPATNFHTENLMQFAKDVDTATAGKLKITVHANASLFKANEIKRAVQGGQAPAGEVLLGNFENENPLYGVDGIPFVATSYAESKRLYDAQKPYLDKLPNDPWGKPYQYANPGLKGDIDVFSYGADGLVGGEGNNAEIGSWQ